MTAHTLAKDGTASANSNNRSNVNGAQTPYRNLG